MSDREFVEVYRAKNGFQADVLVRTLSENGIEAHIVAGTGVHPFQTATNLLGGTALWWDAPRIMVFADDAERARQLLMEYEQRERDKVTDLDEEPPIEVVCEECGQMTSFAASQRGTVQSCPHCDAYVDVGEMDFAEDTNDSDDEPELLDE